MGFLLNVPPGTTHTCRVSSVPDAEKGGGGSSSWQDQVYVPFFSSPPLSSTKDASDKSMQKIEQPYSLAGVQCGVCGPFN